MGKLAVVLLMSIFAISAHATKPVPSGGVDAATALNYSDIGIGINNRDFNTNNLNSSSGSSSGVSNSGNSTNDLNQSQLQGQSVNDSGNSSNHNSAGQLQGQTANNAGNTQHVNLNNAKQYHNTPNLGAIFAYPTAPCALPVGGMGAGAGFGFGFNTAYINQECVKSETAKLAMALSEPVAAREVFCGMEHAQETTLCKDLKKKNHTDHVSGQIKAVPVSQNIEHGKRGMFGMKWDVMNQQWVF